jgi:exopolysaccharide biosynthesis polyprenyl glycosylphosphotransferase
MHQACAADCICALTAGLLAFQLHLGHRGDLAGMYLAISLGLPLVWWAAIGLAGGYDTRLIGVGSNEFRRVLNAGMSLTAAVAILAYATKNDLARGYVLVALPCATLFDLGARYWIRKRLHRLRKLGSCMRRVVVVGHASVVHDLTAMLCKETYHGLTVVAACLASPAGSATRGGIAGVPVVWGLGNVVDLVEQFDADTVAVVGCPEMSGVRLHELAWKLEKTETDLCVAPGLLDVAGPRTTVRPVAGLPLLYLDHPEFTGARRVVKSGFDRLGAALALILAAPVFAAAAFAVRLDDGGPALFRQTRVGRGGRAFTVLKFRTMVLDAEQRKAQLTARNENDGVLFKIRDDPRITGVGRWLRRYSIDELPQLINVLIGDMSLVGPRPALPDEAARYGDYVRRRLAVKPGITGLWQVSGRSDLSWEDSVRLDLRYVENWSFALDLHIMWKTCSAVLRGLGAY